MSPILRYISVAYPCCCDRKKVTISTRVYWRLTVTWEKFDEDKEQSLLWFCSHCGCQECFGHCDGCNHCAYQIIRDLDNVVFPAIICNLAIAMALVVALVVTDGSKVVNQSPSSAGSLGQWESYSYTSALLIYLIQLFEVVSTLFKPFCVSLVKVPSYFQQPTKRHKHIHVPHHFIMRANINDINSTFGSTQRVGLARF